MASHTFVFDDKTKKTMERIKRDFGLCCDASVLRSALALLSLADEAIKSGKQLALVDQSVSNVQRIVI
jgi:hypothetical protein